MTAPAAPGKRRQGKESESGDWLQSALRDAFNAKPAAVPDVAAPTPAKGIRFGSKPAPSVTHDEGNAAAPALGTLTLTERQRIIGEYITARGDWRAAAAGAGLSLRQLLEHLAADETLYDDCVAHDVDWKLPPGATWSLPSGAASTGQVVWTDALRGTFVEAYVNSGDIAAARDAIHVTASQFNAEAESNAEFAAAVAEAKPKADKALEERAVQLALAGNDKLLSLVLKARMPEYRDKIDLRVEHSVRLSDDQLDQRIALLQKRAGVIINGECFEQPQGSRRAVEAPRREGTPRETE